MQRLFLPVGQGAFYCEKFSEEDFCGKVNVVYDCGSVSGFKALKSTIEWVFEKNESIDAVFLSHLHEDHINGLPLLMNWCDVKRVYLPMMAVDDLALMRLAYGVRRHPKPSLYEGIRDGYYMAERFVEDVMREPADAIRRHHSEYSQNRGSTIEVVHIPVGNADGVLNAAYMTSHTVFGNMVGDGLLPKWVYAPFNIRNTLEAERVKQRFVHSFGNDMSPSRIANLIGEADRSEDILDKIRGLYKGIRGGFNANSMTLYSGATDSTLRQYPDVDVSVLNKFNCIIPNYTESGGLYTGDFFAANGKPYWSELKAAYCRFWSNIGCVQVPHHGSKYNFNGDLLAMNAYNVISVGFGNMYHHPSNAVVSQYLARQTFPFIVTQSPNSIFSTTVK